MTSQSLREDVLLSLCLPCLPQTEQQLAELTTQVDRIAKEFRYFEVILVADQATDMATACLEKVANCRIIYARSQQSVYDYRALAVRESLGDVVILTSHTELEQLHITECVRTIGTGAHILISKRRRNLLTDLLLHPLGRLSHFQVSSAFGLTLVMSRTHANRLLAHAEPDVALRFPPHEVMDDVLMFDITPTFCSHDSGLNRARLDVLYRLAVHTSPRLLYGVTLISVFVAITALCYALYACAVYILLDTVQPGWLTTSLVLSLTTFFLGVTLAAVTMGIQYIMRAVSPATGDIMLGEKNRIDLFAKTTYYNVQTTASDAPPNKTAA